MSHYPSTALPIAYVVMRILIVLNWLGAAAIFALLTATIVAESWTFRALGIEPSSWIAETMNGLRAIAALGLVGALLNNIVLTRLVGIIETVRGGDPFVAGNYYRLRVIAWALVGLQLLSIAIAAVGKVISTPENPVALDAGFSINGWLAVLLTFVLARIFAEGTLMREDLEGTI
jgi:hypothetical protein